MSHLQSPDIVKTIGKNQKEKLILTLSMNTVISLLTTFSQFFIGQISNSGQVILINDLAFVLRPYQILSELIICRIFDLASHALGMY